MLHVRELSVEEGRALSRLVKRSNDPTVVKRAMIVLHSFQGSSPPKIAGLVLWSEDWVRRVIKDHNHIGRDALYPKKSPQPEPKFTPEVRKAIVSFTLSRPKDHGWQGQHSDTSSAASTESSGQRTHDPHDAGGHGPGGAISIRGFCPTLTRIEIYPTPPPGA